MPLTDGRQEVPAGKALEWGRGLSYCRRGRNKAHFIGVWFCGGTAVSSERDQPVAAVTGAAGAVRMAAACVVPTQGRRCLVWSNAWFIMKADLTKDNGEKLSVCCLIKCLLILYLGADSLGRRQIQKLQSIWFCRYQTSSMIKQSCLKKGSIHLGPHPEPESAPTDN